MFNSLKTLIISVTLLVGCKGNIKSNPVIEDKTKNLVSQIQLIDMNNQAIRLEDYKGKTVFINFWATWCKPCVNEMPSIEKAQKMMNSKDIVFLLASYEPMEEIIEFGISHNYKFNYVYLKNAELLNQYALPTTFIINPKGVLVFSEMGSRNWDDTTNFNLIKNITKQHD